MTWSSCSHAAGLTCAPTSVGRPAKRLGKWSSCLKYSVRDTGEVINPDKGDMVIDSYYFAAAFLDTIGYFDKSKRFWADKGVLPADTEPLRTAMIAQLSRFNQDLTVVDD